MARMEQENAIRKMLLEYQIAMAQAQGQGRVNRMPSLSDVSRVMF
jgi:hypothetical protein